MFKSISNKSFSIILLMLIQVLATRASSSHYDSKLDLEYTAASLLETYSLQKSFLSRIYDLFRPNQPLTCSSLMTKFDIAKKSDFIKIRLDILAEENKCRNKWLSSRQNSCLKSIDAVKKVLIGCDDKFDHRQMPLAKDETFDYSQVPLAKIEFINAPGWCTGTLVADRVVLTAAHCFENYRGKAVRPKQVLVRQKNGDWSKAYLVEKFFSNDLISGEMFKDIAWIKLRTAPANIGAPISVATNIKNLAVGSPVSHFGYTSKKWFSLKSLAFEVNLPGMFTNNQESEARNWMISAGFNAEAASADASGNSGGPLLFKQDGKWLLLGVLQGEGLFAKNQGKIAAAGFTRAEPFLNSIKAGTGLDIKTVEIKK